MSLVFSIAVFFIIWWTVLFAVLPIGNVSQEEAGEIVPGTPEGAPTAPRLLKKAAITTVISAAIFAVFWVGYEQGWVTFDQMPFVEQGRPPAER